MWQIKKDRHWSTPILAQFYNKICGFGVLITCIILMGDVFTIPCKNVGLN